MAEVEIYTTEKLVKRDVKVYQLELSVAEFVSLRTFLGRTSYNDIVKADLDSKDDVRIENIYQAMSNLQDKEVKNADH